MHTWYGTAGDDSGADAPTCVACRALVANIGHGFSISAQPRLRRNAVQSACTGEHVLSCLVRVGKEVEEIGERELVPSLG